MAAPVISVLDPDHGAFAGGDLIHFTGTGFNTVTAVTFGGTPAAAVYILGNTSMYAVTPVAIPGVVDVVATNPDGDSAPASFTYGFPTIVPAIVIVTAGRPGSPLPVYLPPATVIVSASRPGPDYFTPPTAVVIVSSSRPIAGIAWYDPPTRHSIVVPANQRWAITITGGPTGGTFTITADSGLGPTAPIAWDASITDIQSAVDVAWGLGVVVEGDPPPAGTFRLTFAGTFAQTRYVVTVNTSGLT